MVISLYVAHDRSMMEMPDLGSHETRVHIVPMSPDDVS
jgi:hypothetical protein